MQSKHHGRDQTAIGGKSAQAFMLTVRSCDVGPTLFRYVLSPNPYGGSEYVSPTHYESRRDAFRAGSVYIRFHQLVNSQSLNGNKQHEGSELTYGEMMERLANCGSVADKLS